MKRVVGTCGKFYNRRMKIASLGAAVTLMALTLGMAQAASLREQQSDLTWHKQDICAHDAFAKFPDYTPEGNARRARATRDCERKNHVTPRAATTASPVRRIPDAAAE
jgi:hypothetical protein